MSETRGRSAGQGDEGPDLELEVVRPRADPDEQRSTVWMR